MPAHLDRDQVTILLDELHILIEQARARGDLHVENGGFLPDYWYGVATGYQDCAERLEALLRQ